jgi:gliding motility-associated-like protein
MRLEGGLGDVVGLNNIPIRTNMISSPSSEKIAAVKVLDEDAFWVLSLKADRFYVFKVESTGVAPIPEFGNDGFSISTDLRGYLKTSPDGTKLVSANASSATYLYDFDSATGLVSNEIKLDLSEEFGYGAEFSPSGDKLYISTGNYNPNDRILESLYQYSLDIPNPSERSINATRLTLHTYLNVRAALQLGIDGKIYRASDNNSFLGVINNPEETGVDANYNHFGLNLGSGISGQGLPPFIQSFFTAQIQVNNRCFGDETEFIVNSDTPIDKILWEFGDGATSTLENPTHIYAATGDYDLHVEIFTDGELEIIDQIITISNFPDVNSPVILQQCDDDTDGISLFNLTESEILVANDDTTQLFTYHLTLGDAEDNVDPITEVTTFSNATADKVFVRVENLSRCHSVAQVDLSVSATNIPADFMANLSACDNDLIDDDDNNGITNFDFSAATEEILDLFHPNQDLLLVSYYENMDDALAKLNVIDSENYRNEDSPYSQQIIVRVDSKLNNACIGLGVHLTLEVTPLPLFELTEFDYLCLNNLPRPLVVQVTQAQDSYTYEWRDADGKLLTTNTTSILNVRKAGDYFVTAIDEISSCGRSKKITVIASDLATVVDVDIIDATENNSIDVHVSGEGDYEFALNDIYGVYQKSGFFELSFGGLHTVYIRDINGCGIISHEVVIIDVPKFFTPNGDGINDYWQVSGAYTQPNSVIYVFDRFGKVINQIDAAAEGWDGNYNGNEMPSSDYWYMTQLEDGRILKGHFSLIRR